MTGNPQWTLTTDADISACALALSELHVASEEVRGWDKDGNPIHKLQIHSMDPNSGVMATAEVGCRVTLNGTTPLVMTAEELAAWGISG